MTNAGWYDDPTGRPRYGDGLPWTSNAAGAQRRDPAELFAVLSKLQVPQLPNGDGTPYGEPVLLVAPSDATPGAIEWWSPNGFLIAVATPDPPTPAELQNGWLRDGEDPVATRYEITGGNGVIIARTVRTARPAKPPIHLYDAAGNRVATMQQEKLIALKGSFSVHSNGMQIGRLVASDRRARSVALTDRWGNQIATVLRNGQWGAAQRMKATQAQLPQPRTIGSSLGSALGEKLFSVRPERIPLVLVRERPVLSNPESLIAFAAPLLLEHAFSLL